MMKIRISLAILPTDTFYCVMLDNLDAYQNYILWFYSLRWLIKGIWPLCFHIFELP